MRKGFVATLIATAAVSAGLAAPAFAGQAETTATIRFDENGAAQDIFRGVIRSTNPNCIQDRIVRLFRRQEGPDLFIDSDKSEDNGRWSIDIEGSAPPGDYYVRVTATANCARDRSRVITVP